MQGRYLLRITKDEILQEKYTKTFESKDALDQAYDAALLKYQAEEVPARESHRGVMRTYGLFKAAIGECKHGKKVEIEYSEVQGRKNRPKIK